MLRKDYALAEDSFRSFLSRYPNDRLTGDATYWFGESLFQRQRYDAAAQSFLDLSTKYGTHARAPDALLRLGAAGAGLDLGPVEVAADFDVADVQDTSLAAWCDEHLG